MRHYVCDKCNCDIGNNILGIEKRFKFYLEGPVDDDKFHDHDHITWDLEFCRKCGFEFEQLMLDFKYGKTTDEKKGD
jgi:protein-arginine kinase activator protein McsA